MSAVYTRDVLRLAADIVHVGAIADAAASVERRSPTCGSRVRVDISLDNDDRVTRYGHVVNACALGQASATLVARFAQGRRASEIAQLRTQVDAMLGGGEFAPEGFAALAGARSTPARHASILLPFDAALGAMASARAAPAVDA